MPNTEPINDHAGITQFILKKAAEAGLARVYPIGAVTLGSKGERLAELGEQKAAGCIAFSDDGRPVATALMMRRALEYAGMLERADHRSLRRSVARGDGVAHEGYFASALGLRGIPGVAESLMVERDVSLAELTGSHVHIAHMSARQSLRAVRAGKERGVRVTCEVAPHHFTLTDETLDGPVKYDTNLKMNPPLRDRADRDAMLEGIVDGTIDVIARITRRITPTKRWSSSIVPPSASSDSRPRSRWCSIDWCTLAASVRRAIELLSTNAARVMGLPGGTLAEGLPADVTIIDPDRTVTIDSRRAEVAFEEHTVSWLDVARRRHDDDGRADESCTQTSRRWRR